MPNPGAPTWQFDPHTGSWWLRGTPGGTYRVRFSGWDFRVYRYAPGSRTPTEICSRLNAHTARAAAEHDATTRQAVIEATGQALAETEDT